MDRFLEVEVRGLGGDGRPVRFTARGWQARAPPPPPGACPAARLWRTSAIPALERPPPAAPCSFTFSPVLLFPRSHAPLRVVCFPTKQARILQHEYDHLQGTLYVDRMARRPPPRRRSRAHPGVHARGACGRAGARIAPPLAKPVLTPAFGKMMQCAQATRTFRRVDLVREPLPPPHPEFGSCPPLGVAAAGGQQLPGGARGKGFGGGARGPLVARPEGEGAAGKKKKK